MKPNSCETAINDMTAVIFAGGFGTRLGAITETIPKPMIEVNGRPLLSYIIEHYRNYGVRKFLILGGYRVNQIKQYFANYDLYTRDFIISFPERNIRFLDDTLNCQITVLDTGLNSMTGYRLWYALNKSNIGNNFFLTYGDGISDVNIQDLYESHIRNNALITVTAVVPPGRFGVLRINSNNRVSEFREKPLDQQTRINGGFFVCSNKVLRYLSGDQSEAFEGEPLKNLAEDGEMYAYDHDGFWQPVDTRKDLEELEKYLK